MASTQEIHHTPIQGQDFNIQSGQSNPSTFIHKPHKNRSEKKFKKCCKHKLNKDETFREESDSSLDSSESDSYLESSSSESEMEAPELKPICKHKQPKECSVPIKCFECKHRLNKGKEFGGDCNLHVFPGKKPNFGNSKPPKLDWKHKSKHFECEQLCTDDLECKFKHKKNGNCTSNIQDCFVCDGPSCSTNECLHCEGDIQKWFDCEDRFRRCLICKQELSDLTCECLEHSHFGLCALRIFLTKRCGFFGCHRFWAKPSSKHWSKNGQDPCQTPQPTKF